MSIVMNLYYTGINGNARKFAEEMESSRTADLIRKENGNERYEYFLSMNDPETILLIDIWKDQKSLDLHHASPMMEKIAQLREKYDVHMKAERFLTDDEGIPDSDSKFIKP
ncbi:MAG: antibiotic biosynthesis monooxygenase [Acetatifactor sp.]|nr:antibiotic biosynthesis monooxygenase [Acetatifactor sp.]